MGRVIRNMRESGEAKFHLRWSTHGVLNLQPHPFDHSARLCALVAIIRFSLASFHIDMKTRKFLARRSVYKCMTYQRQVLELYCCQRSKTRALEMELRVPRVNKPLGHGAYELGHVHLRIRVRCSEFFQMSPSSLIDSQIYLFKLDA